MVREGAFPRPVLLAPIRVGWQVATVTEWLEDRQKGLAAKAVMRPEDLAPDQLESTVVDLAVRALSRKFGESVRPEQVTFGYAVRMTQEEEAAHRSQKIVDAEHAFAHFDLDRAVILAGWLFPALRPHLAEATPEEGWHLLHDPEQLRRCGSAALDDDAWAEVEAQLKRIARVRIRPIDR